MSKKFTLKDNAGKQQEYEVSYFLAREGMKIWGDLGGFIKKYAPENEDLNGAGVITLVGDVLAICNDEVIEFLIGDFLKTTTRNGSKLDDANFDVVFAGNYQELFELITKVLEINYGGIVQNFFPKIKAKLASLSSPQSSNKS